jgi:hypothetical protein
VLLQFFVVILMGIKMETDTDTSAANIAIQYDEIWQKKLLLATMMIIMVLVSLN